MHPLCRLLLCQILNQIKVERKETFNFYKNFIKQKVTIIINIKIYDVHFLRKNKICDIPRTLKYQQFYKK